MVRRPPPPPKKPSPAPRVSLTDLRRLVREHEEESYPWESSMRPNARRAACSWLEEADLDPALHDTLLIWVGDVFSYARDIANQRAGELSSYVDIRALAEDLLESGIVEEYHCGGQNYVIADLAVTESEMRENPFVSAAQRRACFAKQDSRWDCEEWNRKAAKRRRR